MAFDGYLLEIRASESFALIDRYPCLFFLSFASGRQATPNIGGWEGCGGVMGGGVGLYSPGFRGERVIGGESFGFLCRGKRVLNK